jgi:hypothetical protein
MEEGVVSSEGPRYNVIGMRGHRQATLGQFASDGEATQGSLPGDDKGFLAMSSLGARLPVAL